MNHYNANFQMMQHHKYSLTELENMMPWEREVYMSMLINYVKEQNEKNKKRLNANGIG